MRKPDPQFVLSGFESFPAFRFFLTTSVEEDRGFLVRLHINIVDVKKKYQQLSVFQGGKVT
jgi:hypothetical protein